MTLSQTLKFFSELFFLSFQKDFEKILDTKKYFLYATAKCALLEKKNSHILRFPEVRPSFMLHFNVSINAQNISTSLKVCL